MTFGRIGLLTLACAMLCGFALNRMMETGAAGNPAMAFASGLLFLTWLCVMIVAFVRYRLRAAVLLLTLPVMAILPALSMIDAMSCSVDCGRGVTP